MLWAIAHHFLECIEAIASNLGDFTVVMFSFCNLAESLFDDDWLRMTLISPQRCGFSIVHRMFMGHQF
jgi:hypothetical protein